MNDALIRLTLQAIALITVITGLSQIVAPGLVLDIAGGTQSPGTNHFFATVGMFMAITGAMFFQALWQRTGERVVALWIGVQKVAACLLVVWAVQKGVLGPLAYGIAAFDFATGLLAWLFMARQAQ